MKCTGQLYASEQMFTHKTRTLYRMFDIGLVWLESKRLSLNISTSSSEHHRLFRNHLWFFQRLTALILNTRVYATARALSCTAFASYEQHL